MQQNRYPSQTREYQRAYRARNREHFNQYMRDWRRAHPERVRTWSKRRRSPRPPIPVDSGVRGWTAGIIDGEGSVQINRYRPRYDKEHVHYRLALQVGATDLGMIQRLKLMWSGTQYRAKRTTSSGKAVYYWCVRSLRAEEVLRAVRPYLVTKANQADLAFEFRAATLGRPRSGDPYRIRLRQLRDRASEELSPEIPRSQ